MPLLLNAREQLAAYVYFESFSTSPLLAACHLLSKHSLPVNSGFGKLADRIGIIVMQQQIQILRVCVCMPESTSRGQSDLPRYVHLESSPTT